MKYAGLFKFVDASNRLYGPIVRTERGTYRNPIEISRTHQGELIAYLRRFQSNTFSIRFRNFFTRLQSIIALVEGILQEIGNFFSVFVHYKNAITYD